VEVSQGTVREALLLLQEEGLVHRQPHRGTTVSDCRAEDAEELIRLRHDIECRGVKRAIAREGGALVDRMAAHLKEMQAAADAGDEYLLSVHD
ncbi:GntR family transcriptional regulator, partial [Staphylococcus pasteuri_A]